MMSHFFFKIIKPRQTQTKLPHDRDIPKCRVAYINYVSLENNKTPLNMPEIRKK